MRRIDADALKKDLTRFYDGMVTAKQLIDEQPTVDAAPVVHAYWWYEDLDGLWCCSNCNGGELVNQKKYCPDCGARMDGGDCSETD